MRFRETDRWIKQKTKRTPLSVAASFLGITARRCAELLAAFEERGELVDRAGGGRVVDVYPIAALGVWDIGTGSYKSELADRAWATANLLHAAPWLKLSSEQRDLMSQSDDAVVASLVARASAIGAVHPVPDQFAARAAREGWIALPSIDLSDLVDNA